MRKFLLVLLTVIVVSGLVFIGCSNQSATSPTTVSQTTTSTTTQSVATAVTPITLVYTEHDTENAWWVQNCIEPWMKEVEQASGGRIKIERHYGGQLVGLMDAYDAAVKGIVDLAYFFPSQLSGRFPFEENIISYQSSDKVNWRPGATYWQLIQQFPEWQNEFNETHLLAVGDMWGPYIGTVKKPINSLDDMKGIQFLATSKLGGNILNAWGAVPANVLPGDLLSSLQKGILDATTVSLKGLGEGLGTGAVLKYITKIASVSTYFALVMNTNKWNSLPPDLQKILTDEGIKLVQEADEIQVYSDPDLKNKMIDRFHLQFNDLPQSELVKFKAAAAPIIEKAATDLDAKGLPGTKVLNAYLQLEQKYSDSQYAPKY